MIVILWWLLSANPASESKIFLEKLCPQCPHPQPWGWISKASFKIYSVSFAHHLDFSWENENSRTFLFAFLVMHRFWTQSNVYTLLQAISPNVHILVQICVQLLFKSTYLAWDQQSKIFIPENEIYDRSYAFMRGCYMSSPLFKTKETLQRYSPANGCVLVCFLTHHLVYTAGDVRSQKFFVCLEFGYIHHLNFLGSSSLVLECLQIRRIFPVVLKLIWDHAWKILLRYYNRKKKHRGSKPKCNINIFK